MAWCAALGGKERHECTLEACAPRLSSRRQLDRLPQHAIIAHLLIERTRGVNDTRAGMIKRHEQPLVPAQNLRRVITKLILMRLDQLQRLKRHCAERGDHWRIDECD